MFLTALQGDEYSNSASTGFLSPLRTSARVSLRSTTRSQKAQSLGASASAASLRFALQATNGSSNEPSIDTSSDDVGFTPASQRLVARLGSVRHPEAWMNPADAMSRRPNASKAAVSQEASHRRASRGFKASSKPNSKVHPEGTSRSDDVPESLIHDQSLEKTRLPPTPRLPSYGRIPDRRRPGTAHTLRSENQAKERRMVHESIGSTAPALRRLVMQTSTSEPVLLSMAAKARK